MFPVPGPVHFSPVNDIVIQSFYLNIKVIKITIHETQDIFLTKYL